MRSLEGKYIKRKVKNQRQYMLHLEAAYKAIPTKKFEKEDKWKVMCLEMELERRYHVDQFEYKGNKTKNPKYIDYHPWTGRRWITPKTMSDALRQAIKDGISKTDDLSAPARTRVAVHDGFPDSIELGRFFWSLYRAKGDQTETETLLDRLDERLTKMFYRRTSKDAQAAQQNIDAEPDNHTAAIATADIDTTMCLHSNATGNNNTVTDFCNATPASSDSNLMENNGVITDACYTEEDSDFLDPEFFYTRTSNCNSLGMAPVNDSLTPNCSCTPAEGSIPDDSTPDWIPDEYLALGFVDSPPENNTTTRSTWNGTASNNVTPWLFYSFSNNTIDAGSAYNYGPSSSYTPTGNYTSPWFSYSGVANEDTTGYPYT